jgi:hypothetical protein
VKSTFENTIGHYSDTVADIHDGMPRSWLNVEPVRFTGCTRRLLDTGGQDLEAGSRREYKGQTTEISMRRLWDDIGVRVCVVLEYTQNIGRWAVQPLEVLEALTSRQGKGIREGTKYGIGGRTETTNQATDVWEMLGNYWGVWERLI